MSLDLPEEQPHIGIKLRTAREAMTMSPSCVGRELKIQPGFIEAIESLDRDALPPIGYVLGYVRAYAKLVGLDPKTSVDDFKADSEVPENLGMRDAPHFVPKRQIRLPKGFFAATTVLSCAAVLAFFYASKSTGHATALSATSEIIPVQAEQIEAMIIDPERMMIKATAPTMVEIRDKDGEILIRQVLLAGQSWEAHQDAGVVLSARDSGALELYLGEDLMGQLGPKGSPIENVQMPAILPDFMTAEAKKLYGLPLDE